MYIDKDRKKLVIFFFIQITGTTNNGDHIIKELQQQYNNKFLAISSYS